ncbi:S8 family serine peptidase [Leucobacter soli]|uniref:S8 family serine peptidase n=2 Tax=Leucobacter soli TaxID=2812850 RepID=UPI0036237578
MSKTSAVARRVLATAAFVALVASLTTSPALGDEPGTEGPTTGPDGAPPPVSVEPEAEDGALADSGLRQIHADWLAGETDLPDVVDDAIRVEVVHDPGVTDIGAALASVGATDIVTLTDELSVATVAVASLPDAELLPGIGYLRLPVLVAPPVDPGVGVLPDDPGRLPGVPAEPSPQRLAPGPAEIGYYGDDILKRVRTAGWHKAKYTGKGVKIGIVDYFSGVHWDYAYSYKDLPKRPTGVFCSFNGTTCTDSVFWNQGSHGVSVAEAIHDVAPGAKLYLATVSTTEDLRRAIDYFASKGVKIVSRSLAAQFDGPGDGSSGPSVDLLNYAVKKGMLWVNSAGNHGVRNTYVSSAGRTVYYGGYWRGTWTDQDEDGWMEFSDPRGNVLPSEMMTSYCNAWIQGLRWNDWGTNRTDYDLYVYAWRSGSWQAVGSSANRQQSGPEVSPIEIPANLTCSGNEEIRFAIWKHHDGNGTANDTLELMVNGLMWDYVSNAGSAGQPYADSKNAGGISVGAVNVSTGVIAEYSSRGPLNDGRKKPDVSAASEFTSVSASDFRFTGTSAATPVVSGVAALILQKNPKWKPATLGKYLRSTANRDRGAKGTDNVYGSGEIRMPLINTKKPKVSGTKRVGKKLKIIAPKWSESGVKVKYQWLRNGKKIKGATSKTYKLRTADRGKRISVKATASKSTYKTVSAASAKTSKIKKK